MVTWAGFPPTRLPNSVNWLLIYDLLLEMLSVSNPLADDPLPRDVSVTVLAFEIVAEFACLTAKLRTLASETSDTETVRKSL